MCPVGLHETSDCANSYCANPYCANPYCATPYCANPYCAGSDMIYASTVPETMVDV